MISPGVRSKAIFSLVSKKDATLWIPVSNLALLLIFRGRIIALVQLPRWLSEKNKNGTKNVNFVCFFQIVTYQWTETRSLPITCSIDKLLIPQAVRPLFLTSLLFQWEKVFIWLPQWINVGFLRSVYQNRWRWARMFGVLTGSRMTRVSRRKWCRWFRKSMNIDRFRSNSILINWQISELDKN